MKKTTCEVCGSPVLVSDGTTKHYIPDLSDIAALKKYIKRIKQVGLDLIVQLKCQNRSLPGEIYTFEDLLREDEKHDA